MSPVPARLASPPLIALLLLLGCFSMAWAQEPANTKAPNTSPTDGTALITPTESATLSPTATSISPTSPATITPPLSPTIPLPLDEDDTLIKRDQTPVVAPVHEPVTRVLEALTAEGKTRVELTIAAAADTYIASNFPAANFGRVNGLFVGYNAQTAQPFGAERILLRFDLPSDLNHAVIERARLRLYLETSHPDNDSAMDTRLIRLQDDWGEETVTWNREPQPRDTSEEYARTSVNNTDGWYTWDISNLVRKWHTNEFENQGVEIYGDERGSLGRERVFYSRETTTQNYPRLVIEYTQDALAPQATVQPLPTWSTRQFTVTWGGTDTGGAGIAYYDVQYRVDSGNWVSWLQQTRVTQTLFTAEHGRVYQFRARAVDLANNAQPFGDPQTQTAVDVNSPATTIQALATTSPKVFPVSWTGSDDLSGLKSFDVDYRLNNGAWQRWLSNTIGVSYNFTATASGTYYFRVQATDQAGNKEAAGNPEAQTVVDADAPVIRVNQLPAITRNSNFVISLGGGDQGGSGLQAYDVQFRFNNGPWTPLARLTTDNTSFTAAVDGVYYFEARGIDNAGNIEPFTNQPEASVAVDLTAPTITPRLYLPIVRR